MTPGAGPRPSRTGISPSSCHLGATPLSLTLSGKNAHACACALASSPASWLAGTHACKPSPRRRHLLHRVDTHTCTWVCSATPLVPVQPPQLWRLNSISIHPQNLVLAQQQTEQSVRTAPPALLTGTGMKNTLLKMS